MEDNIVLVVEDSPTDEALTLRGLKQDDVPKTVVVKRDGAQALEYLLADDAKPRIVLLDLHLPKVGGLEVLRRLRADERTRFLPIVILSSSEEEKDLEEGYRLGVNSYVRKPADAAQYLTAVRGLARYWLTINQPVLAPS
jgi:two-component system response regulator